jgi:hypothetical protein
MPGRAGERDGVQAAGLGGGSAARSIWRDARRALAGRQQHVTRQSRSLRARLHSRAHGPNFHAFAAFPQGIQGTT